MHRETLLSKCSLIHNPTSFTKEKLGKCHVTFLFQCFSEPNIKKPAKALIFYSPMQQMSTSNAQWLDTLFQK